MIPTTVPPMSKRNSLVALTAALVLASFVLPVEEMLKPADHEQLGKLIGKYVSARAKTQGIDKAQEEIAVELEKVRKKVKGGPDPLSLTADLGKSLWQSFAYPAQRGAVKGKVAAVEVAAPFYGAKEKLEYAVWAPTRYVPKQAYPLFLCIGEKGEKPQQHLSDKWTSEGVREGAILAAVPMPDDLAQWTELGGEGKPGGIGNLLTVYGELLRVYAVDFDRVYLCGRGDGVATAVAIASRYPDRFAGVIGRSGDVGATEPDNFRNLPTLFAGAGAGATAFAEKIEKAGYKNCTVQPEADEGAVWAWVQEHPRVSNPTEVVLVPGTPIPYRTYWIEVPQLDAQGGARIVGKADRATNTITLDGEGMNTVTVYFNDLLVDLEKPVKVVCNGTEHIDTIPRNLRTTLELMFYSRSDPGKLYTATKTYDLPAKPKPK